MAGRTEGVRSCSPLPQRDSPAEHLGILRLVPMQQCSNLAFAS